MVNDSDNYEDEYRQMLFQQLLYQQDMRRQDPNWIDDFNLLPELAYPLPEEEEIIKELEILLPTPILPSDKDAAKEKIKQQFQLWNKDSMFCGFKIALQLNLIRLINLTLSLVPPACIPGFIFFASNSAEAIKIFFEYAGEYMRRNILWINLGLIHTCVKGNLEGAELLLKEGGDVNFYSEAHSSTTLEQACRSKTGLVRFLLDHGSSLSLSNSKSSCKQNMLLLASQFGNSDSILSLVEKGERVNDMKMKFSETVYSEDAKKCKVMNQKSYPLLLACLNGQFDNARTLLQCGSMLETIDKLHTQPIHVASEHYGCWYLTLFRSERESKEACKFVVDLIQRGAKFNQARKITRPTFLKSNKMKLVNKTYYETPLHIAVKKGFVDMIWILVAFGGNTVLDVPCKIEDNKEITTTTVWELSDKEDIREALCNNWSPQNHFRYPAPIKNAIVSFLLVMKRRDFQLPACALHRIFMYAAFGWLKNVH